MMRRTCIFCKRSPPEVKISREHVLRAWLRGELGKSDSKVNWRQIYFDNDISQHKRIDRELPHSPYESTVCDVCKPCNEGWLNESVEVPAEQLLVNLARGEFKVIDISGAAALALWAAKTAAVRAVMDKGERMIPDSHYEWIMLNLTPPPFSQVWVGYCDAPYDTWTRHLRWSYVDGEEMCRCHATTFVLGELMLHVVGFSKDPSLLSLASIDSHLQSIFAGSLIRLWPDPCEFTWPLHKKLTSENVFQISVACNLEHSRVVSHMQAKPSRWF